MSAATKTQGQSEKLKVDRCWSEDVKRGKTVLLLLLDNVFLGVETQLLHIIAMFYSILTMLDYFAVSVTEY